MFKTNIFDIPLAVYFAQISYTEQNYRILGCTAPPSEGLPAMNQLELEQEIGKMARAMMTRNTEIGDALITHLKTKLTNEEVAGVVLLSLERLLGYDVELFLWTLRNFIPAEIVHEIRYIASVTLCKQLIGKKFMLGKDFSVDADGKLLLNEQAKKAILPYVKSPNQVTSTALT